MIKEKFLSIVIPSFNEEKNIEELYFRLLPIVNAVCLRYEIIFIDDGSNDSTFQVIQSIAEKNPYVFGFSLSRNFGHQVAIMAGLQQSKGDIVIMMDADMQHPPEIIPLLIEASEKGFDIVNTKRIDSSDTGFFKKITSKNYYRLINFLSDVHIEPASADFRLMTRKAVDAFIQIEEKDRFTRGLVSWIGFRQTIIEYKAAERFSGKSKYTLKKMFRFGIDGLTSFSSKPLRLSSYFGILFFIIGLIYALYAIITHVATKNTVPGWTSILVSVLIIGGVQLLSIGIVGEYIARIFNETKGRPMYFFKDQTK